MAGGRSSRFASIGQHKSMAAVQGMPVIGHVIDFWSAHADEFVFIVKNGKDQLKEYVQRRGLVARFAEPSALRGIADGLLAAEPLVEGPFIMVLGDCFGRGTFTPPAGFSGHGIGVQRGALASETRRNYAVETEGSRVVRVVEKPEHVPNDLCGTGFYFFQRGIFDAIRATPVSVRSGEHEITDVLQTLVDGGSGLAAVWFDGAYVNINTPADLALVEDALARPPQGPQGNA